jgi:hypothetical protein
VALAVIRRGQLHRGVFSAAGLYNVAWGLWSVVDPQWLFRLTGMPLSNYPAVFACLGMVVGLYGVLYFEVARPRTRLAHRSGRSHREGTWSNRHAVVDREWQVASVGSHLVPDQRCHLVDSVRALPD